MIRSMLSTVLLGAVFLTAGCGDGGAADLVRMRRSNLATLGAAYLSYYQEQGESPTSVSALADYMKASASDPKTADAITALTEGDVIMIFDGQLADADNSAQRVIGFEAGVPATGGYVVMGDGKVRLMTIKDFSEASMISQAQR